MSWQTGSGGGGFTAVRPAAPERRWSKSESFTGSSRRRILLAGAEQTGHESWRRRGAAAGVCPGKNGKNWRKCAGLRAWSTGEEVSWRAVLFVPTVALGSRRNSVELHEGKCWWKRSSVEPHQRNGREKLWLSALAIDGKKQTMINQICCIQQTVWTTTQLNQDQQQASVSAPDAGTSSLQQDLFCKSALCKWGGAGTLETLQDVSGMAPQASALTDVRAGHPPTNGGLAPSQSSAQHLHRLTRNKTQTSLHAERLQHNKLHFSKLSDVYTERPFQKWKHQKEHVHDPRLGMITIPPCCLLPWGSMVKSHSNQFLIYFKSVTNGRWRRASHPNLTLMLQQKRWAISELSSCRV